MKQFYKKQVSVLIFTLLSSYSLFGEIFLADTYSSYKDNIAEFAEKVIEPLKHDEIEFAVDIHDTLVTRNKMKQYYYMTFHAGPLAFYRFSGNAKKEFEKLTKFTWSQAFDYLKNNTDFNSYEKKDDVIMYADELKKESDKLKKDGKKGYDWKTILTKINDNYSDFSKYNNDVKNYANNVPEWQDAFIAVAQKYPELKQYIPVIFEIDNARDPIKGMPELVKGLSDNDYQLYILSNIHPNAYSGWIGNIDEKGTKGSAEGLRDLMPEIFSYFKDAQTIMVNGKRLKKPDAQAFTTFINTFKDGKKLTIFIDNEQENIDASIKNGFDVGILFKSAEELKKDLKDIGIKFDKEKKDKSE